MGKLIDVNKWFKDTFPKADLDYSTLDNKKTYPHWSTDITGLVNILNDAESVEAIQKDQYETRLKADMIAMLTDIQLEIEECVDGAEGSPQFEQGVTNARVQVVEMIQEKIDKLKENNDEADKSNK